MGYFVKVSRRNSLARLDRRASSLAQEPVLSVVVHS